MPHRLRDLDGQIGALLLPDDDLSGGVGGGEEPLARTEGDRRDGPRVPEQFVGDGVGRRPREVEEEHRAVLGAGRHAGPLAERQQWGDHGRPAGWKGGLAKHNGNPISYVDRLRGSRV